MAEEREGEENRIGEGLVARIFGFGFGYEVLVLGFDLDFRVRWWGIGDGEGEGEGVDLRRERGNLADRMEGGSFPIFKFSLCFYLSRLTGDVQRVEAEALAS